MISKDNGKTGSEIQDIYEQKGAGEDAVVIRFVVGLLATNAYLLYGKDSREGVLLDPGAYDAKISECIKDRDIDVICTLNTHGHADHILGDDAFGFPVLIHKFDKTFLEQVGWDALFSMEPETPTGQGGKILEDGDIIEIGKLRLEIIHTPGHTQGSVSVRCGDMLFSGDTLFFEGVGRTDLPGGDHDTLRKSINEKLMVLPDEMKVFPGHGPETTIGHERRSNPFI